MPPQERLVPIPQGAPRIRVADKPLSAEATRADVVLHWNEAALNAIKSERRIGRDLADSIARQYLLPVQTNALTGGTQLISTRRRHFSINLADRPRGEPRSAPLGR